MNLQAQGRPQAPQPAAGQPRPPRPAHYRLASPHGSQAMHINRMPFQQTRGMHFNKYHTLIDRGASIPHKMADPVPPEMVAVMDECLPIDKRLKSTTQYQSARLAFQQSSQNVAHIGLKLRNIETVVLTQEELEQLPPSLLVRIAIPNGPSRTIIVPSNAIPITVLTGLFSSAFIQDMFTERNMSINPSDWILKETKLDRYLYGVEPLHSYDVVRKQLREHNKKLQEEERISAISENTANRFGLRRGKKAVSNDSEKKAFTSNTPVIDLTLAPMARFQASFGNYEILQRHSQSEHDYLSQIWNCMIKDRQSLRDRKLRLLRSRMPSCREMNQSFRIRIKAATQLPGSGVGYNDIKLLLAHKFASLSESDCQVYVRATLMHGNQPISKTDLTPLSPLSSGLSQAAPAIKKSNMVVRTVKETGEVIMSTRESLTTGTSSIHYQANALLEEHMGGGLNPNNNNTNGSASTKTTLAQLTHPMTPAFREEILQKDQLMNPQSTRGEECLAFWGEWLCFDIATKHLPSEAHLAIQLVARPSPKNGNNTRDHFSSTVIGSEVDVRAEKKISKREIIIGWTNYHIFSSDGELVQGHAPIPLWPGPSENHNGVHTLNRSDERPALLSVEFDTYTTPFCHGFDEGRVEKVIEATDSSGNRVGNQASREMNAGEVATVKAREQLAKDLQAPKVREWMQYLESIHKRPEQSIFRRINEDIEAKQLDMADVQMTPPAMPIPGSAPPGLDSPQPSKKDKKKEKKEEKRRKRKAKLLNNPLISKLTNITKFNTSDFPEHLNKIQAILERSPLKPMSLEERKLIWRHRYIVAFTPVGGAYGRLMRAAPWAHRGTTLDAIALSAIVRERGAQTPDDCLELLGTAFADYNVRVHATLGVNSMEDHKIAAVLLQLVQTLKFEPEHHSILAQCLLRRGLLNFPMIGHELYWHLRAELSDHSVAERFGVIAEAFLLGVPGLMSRPGQPPVHAEEIWKESIVCKKLATVSLAVQNHHGKLTTVNERGEQVVRSISRSDLGKELLSDMDLPDEFRLPLNYYYVCSGIDPSKCKAMDSKKVPIFLSLKNVDPTAPPVFVMFKCGDDLRQDQLVLQMLRLMNEWWRDLGLDLNMSQTTYACIATNYMEGMLEIVTESDTVAKIFKEKGGGAMSALLSKEPLALWLNEKNNVPLDAEVPADVRHRFALSLAGYSVATYVLGIGDRHNDNIMVRQDGSFFHIDFGHFLGHFKTKFGIRRERAPISLHPSYAYALGGYHSNDFKFFERQASSAYLVLRKPAYSRLLFFLLSLMAGCGMEELRSESNAAWIEGPLELGLSEAEAEKLFRKTVLDCFKSFSTKLMHMIHIAAH